MYSQSLDMQAYLAMRDDRFLAPISRLDSSNPMSGPDVPEPRTAAGSRWPCPTQTRTGPPSPRSWGWTSPIPRFDSHEKRCEAKSPRDDAGARGAVLQEAAERPLAEAAREKQLPADVIEKYDYPAADHERHRGESLHLESRSPEPRRDPEPRLPDLHERQPRAAAHAWRPCARTALAEILQEQLGHTTIRDRELRGAGNDRLRADGF